MSGALAFRAGSAKEQPGLPPYVPTLLLSAAKERWSVSGLAAIVDSSIEFLVLYGMWILFVGNSSHSELVVGAICALLGAVSDALVKASGFGRFYVRPMELMQALLVPWYILRDTVSVGLDTLRRALGGKGRSRWLELPYRRTKDVEADRADRALATALTTMSPNDIVVGIDRKKRCIYIHQLVPRPASLLLKNLGVES